MPRITKTLAETIAYSMTMAKKKEMYDLADQMALLAYAVSKTSIPQRVFIAFEQSPKFFKTLSYRRFSGGGLNFEEIYFPKGTTLPYNGSDYTVVASEEDGAELLRLHDKHALAVSSYNSLRRDIKNTILAIGTYARLHAEFPEAAAFLPPATTALSINVSDLIKRL